MDEWSTPQMARVGETLLRVIARRLPMGLKESGAQNYYARRVRQGFAFERYTTAISAAVVNERPNYELMVDVGSGMGELPFLLAVEGFRTLAIERNALRFAALTDFHSELAKLFPEFAARAQIHRGDFPCPVVGLIPDHSLLTATSLVATTTPEQERRIMTALLEYRALIVDVAQLVHYRPNPEEWPTVERYFKDAGFNVRREIFTETAIEPLSRVIWFER